MSLRERWFSPGYEIEIQADYWKDLILKTKIEGAKCKKYLEVRYEDLITDPEETLKKICTFLDLDFSDNMLNHYKKAGKRLDEHGERLNSDGSVLISSEDRVKQQNSSREPVNKKKIGKWKEVLTADEQKTYQQIAGDLLKEYGYDEE